MSHLWAASHECVNYFLVLSLFFLEQFRHNKATDTKLKLIFINLYHVIAIAEKNCTTQNLLRLPSVWGAGGGGGRGDNSRTNMRPE